MQILLSKHQVPF